MEEVLDPGAPQRGGDDAALPAPILALGREHPVEPHPDGGRFEGVVAAEAVRAFDQNAFDRGPVRQRRNAARPDADAVGRLLVPGPALQHRMQPAEADPRLPIGGSPGGPARSARCAEARVSRIVGSSPFPPALSTPRMFGEAGGEPGLPAPPVRNSRR